MDYSKLVEVYESLSKSSRRLDKIFTLSKFIPLAGRKEILLLQGRVYPIWDSRKLGMSQKLVLKALALASGFNEARIEKLWKELGDLGLVSAKVILEKKQRTLFNETLTVDKIFLNFEKISSLEGNGTVDTKIKILAELYGFASSLEAQYITRTVLEDLRVGMQAGSFRDGIVWCYFAREINLSYEKGKIEVDRDKYNEKIALVQNAYDITNDFWTVISALREGGVEKLSLKSGIPLKAMLAIKASDINDAFERVGSPAQFEYKYDGFRIQAHKMGDKIKLFTRGLEDVTFQFPDIVEALRKNVKGDSYILDSESIGIDKKRGKFLPFQAISQRIRRKYRIEEMVSELPCVLMIFDIMFYNGENYLNKKLSERRELLENIVSSDVFSINLSEKLISGNASEVKRFFDDSILKGNEGLMAKSLDAPYKPGSRVGFMVKIKDTMENLDLVIVGAEWGEGKRSSWLSSFLLACRSDDNGFLEIGKVGTGIKEKSEEGVSFEQLTEILKPLIISENGREVKVRPEIVVEISYEEIQKSASYGSGYALRFPRFVALREDRGVNDISSLSEIEDFFLGQNKR